MLIPVPRTDPYFAAAWDVARRLMRSIDEDVLASRLDDCTAQLWVAVDDNEIVAACVTEIVGRACNIWKCGGAKSAPWPDYAALIGGWAKEQGCSVVRIDGGRPGWMRVFRDWKLVSVELEKKL